MQLYSPMVGIESKATIQKKIGAINSLIATYCTEN